MYWKDELINQLFTLRKFLIPYLRSFVQLKADQRAVGLHEGMHVGLHVHGGHDQVEGGQQQGSQCLIPKYDYYSLIDSESDRSGKCLPWKARAEEWASKTWPVLPLETARKQTGCFFASTKLPPQTRAGDKPNELNLQKVNQSITHSKWRAYQRQQKPTFGRSFAIIIESTAQTLFDQQSCGESISLQCPIAPGNDFELVFDYGSITGFPCKLTKNRTKTATAKRRVRKWWAKWWSRRKIEAKWEERMKEKRTPNRDEWPHPNTAVCPSARGRKSLWSHWIPETWVATATVWADIGWRPSYCLGRRRKGGLVRSWKTKTKNSQIIVEGAVFNANRVDRMISTQSQQHESSQGHVLTGPDRPFDRLIRLATHVAPIIVTIQDKRGIDPFPVDHVGQRKAGYGQGHEQEQQKKTIIALAIRTGQRRVGMVSCIKVRRTARMITRSGLKKRWRRKQQSNVGRVDRLSAQGSRRRGRRRFAWFDRTAWDEKRRRMVAGDGGSLLQKTAGSSMTRGGCGRTSGRRGRRLSAHPSFVVHLSTAANFAAIVVVMVDGRQGVATIFTRIAWTARAGRRRAKGVLVISVWVVRRIGKHRAVQRQGEHLGKRWKKSVEINSIKSVECFHE